MMTPRKKDKRKPPEIVTPVMDESDVSQEEDGGCSGSCPKSGLSGDSDNDSC